MEKRVKIFENFNKTHLEEHINSWLEIASGKMHDIKFVVASDTTESLGTFAALLIYTPEEL